MAARRSGRNAARQHRGEHTRPHRRHPSRFQHAHLLFGDAQRMLQKARGAQLRRTQNGDFDRLHNTLHNSVPEAPIGFEPTRSAGRSEHHVTRSHLERLR